MEKDSNADQPLGERIDFAGYEQTKVPPELEDKIVQSLRNKGFIGKRIDAKWMGVRIAVSLFLVAGIFYTGWIFGKKDNNTRPTITAVGSADSSFLLLLYNSPGFIESKTHAKEYGDWMRALNNNQVASGQELKKNGWQISMPGSILSVDNHPVLTNKGRISGFFLIKAADDKKALEIALSCPHVKHKGMIELRPVQSH